jgi:hypothetical protein
VVVGLGHRRAEAAVKLRLHGLQLLAFPLQASIVGKVQLDYEDGDEAHSSSRSTCFVS